MAAEAQAKTGHDVYAFDMWTVHEFADKLDAGRRRDEEADRQVRQGLGTPYEYLGVADGTWLAVPVGWGSAPLTPCGRISMLKQYAGIDVQKWFPDAKSTPDAVEGLDL